MIDGLAHLPVLNRLSSSIPAGSQSELYGAAATRLRIPVPDREMRMPRGGGVGGGKLGRAIQLRQILQALFDEERLELRWPIATESRLYAERLIQEAVRASLEPGTEELVQLWLRSEPGKIIHLDDLAVQVSSATLELAVFWLTKPHLVEKLFKVSSHLCFPFLLYPITASYPVKYKINGLVFESGFRQWFGAELISSSPITKEVLQFDI